MGTSDGDRRIAVELTDVIGCITQVVSVCEVGTHEKNNDIHVESRDVALDVVAWDDNLKRVVAVAEVFFNSGFFDTLQGVCDDIFQGWDKA